MYDEDQPHCRVCGNPYEICDCPDDVVDRCLNCKVRTNKDARPVIGEEDIVLIWTCHNCGNQWSSPG